MLLMQWNKKSNIPLHAWTSQARLEGFFLIPERASSLV